MVYENIIRQYHYEEKDGVIFVKDELGNYIYELKRINPYKMLINDEVFYCANKKMNYTTTEGFYTLSEVKESYSFQKQTMSDEVYGDVIFMGKYELCKSGTESIVVSHNHGTYETYIEINGIKKQINVSAVENVAIIDVNESDSYKEIAIFDLGEKGECTLKIFRYNDGQIFELGSYNGDGTYDSILFNKQGSIIESNGYNENQIVLEYYEISGENVFKIEVDQSSEK